MLYVDNVGTARPDKQDDDGGGGGNHFFAVFSKLYENVEHDEKLRKAERYGPHDVYSGGRVR